MGRWGGRVGKCHLISQDSESWLPVLPTFLGVDDPRLRCVHHCLLQAFQVGKVPVVGFLGASCLPGLLLVCLVALGSLHLIRRP